jgi:hypothetical protein
MYSIFYSSLGFPKTRLTPQSSCSSSLSFEEQKQEIAFLKQKIRVLQESLKKESFERRL